MGSFINASEPRTSVSQTKNFPKSQNIEVWKLVELMREMFKTGVNL